VAKALIADESLPAPITTGTAAGSFHIAPSGPVCCQQLLFLLHRYEAHLITAIRASLLAAAGLTSGTQGEAGSTAAAQQTAHAAAAAAVASQQPQAFDDNLDRALELAWVHLDRLCLGSMMQEVDAEGTGDARPGLAAMAALFGLTRTERYLAGLMQVSAAGLAPLSLLGFGSFKHVLNCCNSEQIKQQVWHCGVDVI
jgi:hypothetical protein